MHPVAGCRAGLLALGCLLAAAATADCARDLAGEVYCGAGQCLSDRAGTVWCSRHHEGGAAKTREGEVVCGRGDCARRADGRVFCSSEIGGAVTRDARGRIRCHGRCETGSPEHCEHTVAGSSG